MLQRLKRRALGRKSTQISLPVFGDVKEALTAMRAADGCMHAIERQVRDFLDSIEVFAAGVLVRAALSHHCHGR